MVQLEPELYPWEPADDEAFEHAAPYPLKFNNFISFLWVILGPSACGYLPRDDPRVLVVGTGPRARDFYEKAQAHPEWGVEVVGFAEVPP